MKPKKTAGESIVRPTGVNMQKNIARTTKRLARPEKSFGE